ncbi:MAG: cupin domain-containing protein [Acinetobacter populi]|jgi:50S ribosomal protein L16 3-hydroxylase|uniref:ribosomal protein uL16 3-hydroxylase n=1 Tax=Acinetobacter populi TaxID=1582270 RepID=UPI002354E3F0|nr:cupin domain-containing protein [Acinetobacter populi]MCH4246228.1 cupin domain-containing protein [Acinetobacter populi]
MSEQLSILGGLTAEQFLTEYWQKKPLLVRNALPEIVGMFEPDDIKELALEDHITARLITQNGKLHDDWKVKNSPLSKKDFKKLPPYWTLLVQAVDHYSIELAELWKQFAFIPQWRRDDIMVSYAPKGGSVGQHFDFYDVFLLQGFGHRRWQLGQWCDESSALIANQPLKLLTDMQIDFDEVLAPGDLLYVPPRLSHYGVAQDECLTFSFGFRMPNPAQLIDRVSDRFAEQMTTKTPMIDINRSSSQDIGEIKQTEFDDLKQKLLQLITHNAGFESAVMELISEPKYPDNIPELEEIRLNDLKELENQGFYITLEPASRLLYRTLSDQKLEFWANGEKLEIDPSAQDIFKTLADGENILLDNILTDETQAEDILDAINQAILMLNEPEE